MMETAVKDIKELKVHGRTTTCREPLTLFWTASGFECNVSGSELWVEVEVTYDTYEPWFSYTSSAGRGMRCTGNDLQNGAVIPTMRGNTYVQDKGQMLFVKRDEQHDCYPETTLATSEQALMEKCVREYMGDTSGQVIILE